MRRQTRPFIVEVKQKRGSPKRARSIWGDLDLSAFAAETKGEPEVREMPNPQLIDSNVTPVDAESGNKPQVEHLMPDPQETETAQSVTEAPAKAEPAEAKKKAARPKRAAQARPTRSAAKKVAKTVNSETVSPARDKAVRRAYSEKERTQKLGQIEKSIGRGASIRNATKQAGISEQTYYQWKKATASAQEGGELKDLLALEQENARLKKLLAERLRKENAELKKKLGLGSR